MPAATGQVAVRELLFTGAEKLALPLSQEQGDALEHYIGLLVRWNAAYNLTAIRDPVEMVSRHLLDSLSLAPLLPAESQRLIDVGSGAGLPGVPLAILLSERRFDLLDSNGKKTRFLFQVKTELGLSNIAVCHARAEAWKPVEQYDVVLSRAFASLDDMIRRCAHLCRPGGLFLAMKGQRPDREIEQLPASVTVSSVRRLQVPGLAEERHAIALQLKSESRRTDGKRTIVD
jgi:16S rRNA (guanine527-N7)-methyltransferase